MSTLDFFSVFAAAFGVGVLLILTRNFHGRWTGDAQNSGIQKHHQGNPPRVGLLPILAGCGIAALLLPSSGRPDVVNGAHLLSLLLLCAAPAAFCGLLEDVTKKVRVRWRLLGPILGVCLAAWLMGALIPTLGIPGLNELVTFWPVALLVTLLMVVGFTNAMNIVDGLNGLASGLAVLMLGATAFAAYQAGDMPLFHVCSVIALAVLGFMVINFPRGLMFLGDGGAYFLGFSLAVIWTLLLVRNPSEISPWFVMGVAFHPTMETIFSIVRRKARARKRNATAPDRLHLHTLVYRRRLRPLAKQFSGVEGWVPNAGAAVILLAMALVPITVACLRPFSDVWGALVCLLGVALYLGHFFWLVRFRGFLLLRLVQAARARRLAPQLDVASAFDGQ